ncbi:ATPase, AAA family protein, putative [Babesia bigemina]|uniref:ATPase, AAA family protein, putative n=1 Tax=Babesia bigemina TaxID=5866 RepID=A0A061CZE1_BABBI|nr:ATPase, AAA family protein, putative [Babesia bigemina]CDR93783.1 ATPase, AAA family protein, putative [Babesia bigemina]|eukprot:XP_012765969.1 ATPase, AAA family protein, putative [Babesia bigemina]
MASFELAVTFLARKLQFSAHECGQNVIVAPAQTFKKYRIEHGSTVLLSDTSGGRVVCAQLRNAVEHGMEYSFLKAPKMLASEELILSLGAAANTPITLRLSPCEQVPVAKSVTMTYMEHFDSKLACWKVPSTQEEDAIDASGGKSGAAFHRKYMDWSHSDSAGDNAFPTARWWYSFLKGDMNRMAQMSVLGGAFAQGNVVALNLKGVLARFKVADIANDDKKRGGRVGRVTESTQLALKLPRNERLSQPTRALQQTQRLEGLREPLDTLRKHVVYPLVYSEKYAAMGIFPPTGVILHGPPGCGKTMIAKAMREGFGELFGIAEHVDVEVKLVQSSDLISSVVARTEENIADLFRSCEKAAREKPCICFIDEIDVLCRKRDGSTEFNMRNVTTFLNHMDGVGSQTNAHSRGRNYVIIGATNDVDSMDAALRRPGRFDLEIEVGVPNSADRLAILKSMLKDIHHNLEEKDILHVNDYCQAFVGADLKQLVANASWARLNKTQNQRGSTESVDGSDDGGSKTAGDGVDGGSKTAGDDGVDGGGKAGGDAVDVGSKAGGDAVDVGSKAGDDGVDGGSKAGDDGVDGGSKTAGDGAGDSDDSGAVRDEPLQEDLKGAEVPHCVTLEDFKEALNITRPSALRELYVQIANVRWDDIGGYDDVKRILKECVEYPRTYSEAYEKMRVQTPRGVLLYGPPGCSKTLMAKAVATESHMNFISVKGPELFSKWVGESERAIRQLFRRARTNAPCVIFFDEMDSISFSRELSDSGGVSSRVLSQLLNEMDGINSLKQVLVIGATNRPDLMDAALLRPGRLDRLVYIPLPDGEARKRIFSIYLKRLPTDGFDIERQAEEFAKCTEGYSGAEITLVCRESAMAALRELISRDAEAKAASGSRTDDKRDDSTLENAFGNLKVSKIVPVSVRHVRDAIARVKPRTKPETIRFYEQYKARNPF